MSTDVHLLDLLFVFLSVQLRYLQYHSLLLEEKELEFLGHSICLLHWFMAGELPDGQLSHLQWPDQLVQCRELIFSLKRMIVLPLLFLFFTLEPDARIWD